MAARPKSKAIKPKRRTNAGLEPAPAHIDHGSSAGLENMRGQDMTFPRLVLLQMLSPECKREEQKPGTCLESLNRTVLFERGEEMKIVPFLHFVSWIEWKDRDEGGGIIAASMDPASELASRSANRELDLKGNLVVTEYHNFVVFMPEIFDATGDPMASVIMIPCAKTNYKHGRRLLMLARMRNAPLYAGRYSLSTELVERNNNAWYELVIDNAGWASEEEYELCQELHAQYGPMLKQGRVKYVPEADEDFEAKDVALSEEDAESEDQF